MLSRAVQLHFAATRAHLAIVEPLAASVGDINASAIRSLVLWWRRRRLHEGSKPRARSRAMPTEKDTALVFHLVGPQTFRITRAK
eukprot:6169060-Pyramimonas_sp.AAC.1